MENCVPCFIIRVQWTNHHNRCNKNYSDYGLQTDYRKKQQKML